jgi:hypothetical protein
VRQCCELADRFRAIRGETTPAADGEEFEVWAGARDPLQKRVGEQARAASQVERAQRGELTQYVLFDRICCERRTADERECAQVRL